MTKNRKITTYNAHMVIRVLNSALHGQFVAPDVSPDVLRGIADRLIELAGQISAKPHLPIHGCTCEPCCQDRRKYANSTRPN